MSQQSSGSRIVGIVNLTPDSFSDGGKLDGHEAALAHMARLLEEGAAVLDIGAESTRPGATPLSSAEEWARLSALLPAARNRFPDAILSIDTRHAATAALALEAGADWINDVSDAADPAMVEVLRAQGTCAYVVTHSLSVPPRAGEVLPEDTDIIALLRQWVLARAEALEAQGISRHRLIFDPGLGFGKTAAQSWRILRDAAALRAATQQPWLIGHSRKSFFGPTQSGHAEERDADTHAVSAYLAAQGVEYLRVHDVRGTKRAIAAGEQLKTGEGWQ